MTPFWIINFLEKDSCESFFNAYWNAYLQNCHGNDTPLKPFHITKGNEENLTREELNEIAFKKLTISTDFTEKLIPAFTNNQGNKINVIFIGDITQEKTIERFHTWAAYLQQQRMIDVSRPWFSISSVSMYGILLRPETIAVDDAVLTDRVKGFLNELNTLERMDENHRPFNSVLFLQVPVKKEARVSSEYAAYLTAYHIARTDGQCLKNYDKQYFDTAATAVFFESEVQKEIDAFNLSTIMLHDLVTSDDKEFYDINEAQQFVEDNQQYVDTLKPTKMISYFVSGCPILPKSFVPQLPGKFLSILNNGNGWKKYYDELKNNIISILHKNLSNFDKDFCEKLYCHQKDFITDRSHALQDLVFQMFCDTGSQFRFKHISLKQSLKILELFKNRITDAFKDKVAPIHTLELPDDLKMAYVKAKKAGLSPEEVLKRLNEQIDHLPIYSNSSPFFCSIRMLFSYFKVKRIESLKNQYVGMRLQKLYEHLNEQLQHCVEKTQQEMRQYMKWLRDEKLIWLQNNLSVMAVPGFQFQKNKVFQPLINTSFTSSKSLIASKLIDISKENILFESGTFGDYPLTKNVPTAQVYSVDKGSLINISDLIDYNKPTVQSLVQNLMRHNEVVIDGKEQEVDFQKHESSNSNRRMLLLLDVSGSMFGEMNNLIEYVKNLENVGEIEWIAFDDKVVATSHDSDIETLSSGGGTCYIPAINKAVEWVKSDDYDDIILLSDGGPFETIEKIVSSAIKLNQPLNTIAVGKGAAENVLVEIAFKTGGEEITVDSFEDITQEEVWNNEILPRLAIFNKGNYSFGELMKHTQVTACAKALKKYVLKCLETRALTMPEVFVNYTNEPGFEEWLSITAQRNTLAPAIDSINDKYCFATAKAPKMDEMKKSLQKHCKTTRMEFEVCNDEPEMIVSLMSVRPLMHISDLQWASSMEHGNKSINNANYIKEFLQQGDVCVNVYDEEI